MAAQCLGLCRYIAPATESVDRLRSPVSWRCTKTAPNLSRSTSLEKTSAAAEPALHRSTAAPIHRPQSLQRNGIDTNPDDAALMRAVWPPDQPSNRSTDQTETPIRSPCPLLGNPSGPR